MFFFDNSKSQKKKIPKAVKDMVWYKYIGADKAEGKCYVCGRTIHITDFDLGHNKAKAKGGGDSIANLRPICRTCNTSMQTTSIETFKARHFDKPKVNHKQDLENLTVKELKFLANKHHIRVNGHIVESFFESHAVPPTRGQYINKLAKIVTAKELTTIHEDVSKPINK
jgi:hypothetical protein